MRTAGKAGFSVVAVEDPISQSGEEGETQEGIASLADLTLGDYQELIDRLLPPEEDLGADFPPCWAGSKRTHSPGGTC